MVLKEHIIKEINNVRLKEHVGSSAMVVSVTIQRRNHEYGNRI